MKKIYHQAEAKRKLSLLKIILTGVIVLSFVASVINFITIGPYGIVMELFPSIVFVVFTLLYILARRRVLVFPSLVLVGLLSSIAYYLSFYWGTVIPHSWVLLALTVIIGGILISARFALFLVTIHTVVMLLLTHLQNTGQIKYEWWDIKPTIGSVLVTMVILGVIALISWLSNREIEKALQRAHKSEEMLKGERDMLEIKVEERAKQIRNAQMKQVMELYRFADFGRLAAGLFHDMVDPLSVVSLNLENLKSETARKKLSEENRANIRSALKMVTENQRRVEMYVNSTRRQLQGQQLRTEFDLKAEIDRAIADLTPKANSSRVLLEFHCRKPIFTFGNHPRFHQLMRNLISNAIDAYDGVRRRKNRMVIIKLACQEKQVICSVADFGSGISTKHLPQIFTPFFTTKPLDKGMGIGLSIAKDIAERDYKGEISGKSGIHKGTVFTVKFPITTK